MSDQIRAPFSEAQIAALNAYQRSGRMHPFTCGGEHELHQTLIAEQDGWHCPDERCDYRQDWAHAFMADPAALAVLAPPWPELSESAKAQAAQQLAHSFAGQLRNVRQQLRMTEDELALERQRTQALREELRMLEATRQLAGRPLVPEQAAGDCDATWMPKPIKDVPTGGML